jgi:plasmid stabilization system protein ParE
MRLKVLPSALDDLRRGWQFYERQQTGLGDYFQDSLISDIDSLILYAGIHRVVHGYHRMLSKRFPYAIYYKMDGQDLAVVWRVLDMRESPEKTKRKLS